MLQGRATFFRPAIEGQSRPLAFGRHLGRVNSTSATPLDTLCLRDSLPQRPLGF